MGKYISEFDRVRTIGVLQGLIAQNDIKDNPNRIPLGNLHIEALQCAIALLLTYEETLKEIKEFSQFAHQTANKIEREFTFSNMKINQDIKE